MNVSKRDGRKVTFNPSKIVTAITQAFREVDGEISNDAWEKAQCIADYIAGLNKDLSVEEIQDIVEKKLMASSRKDVAKAYIIYRNNRNKYRQRKSKIVKDTIELMNGTNEYLKGENSNKDSVLSTTQRDYMAGIISSEMTRNYLLPQSVVEAHDNGLIHFHDADYFAQRMHNCDLINLEDMLQNGTMISEVLIEKPHTFSTACTITTQIIAQVASSQYGGQSVSLSHLAPFVDISRQKIRRDVCLELNMLEINVSNEQIDKIVHTRLLDEISKGIQTIQYQVVTLMTTNGQAPFLTVFMYLNEATNEQEKEDLALLIEEMLKQRYQGVKNESGVWVTPAFPKLIYVLEEDNIHVDSKYYYLTQLAAKCTAKRMVPDYISEKKMKELKEGNCFPVMGCRSALSPWKDENGNYKFYGRFNQGVVTINLPDVALSSGGNMEKFWKIFDERLELCHKALRCRHERLLGTSSDVAPILWRYGALARLPKGATIDELLVGGYSTISLGYAGLYECVKYMTGKSHSDEGDGETFGLKVMQYMNDKCNEWKGSEHIDYSLYGTPLESTTYKFAKCLKDRFGEIKGITDRNYITNSYHIPVFEEINPFEKLRIESKFQKLSPGGAISYIESADMTHNIPAILEIIKYIYDNIMYAEINTKSDYCQVCGYDKEIDLIDKNNTLIWHCPNCGNEDTRKMNVARRTCGYIGTATNGWNQGRLGDIHDRYIHLDDHAKEC